MRLAFVTPRYGAEIGGGPEHACRLLAEQLSARHDVDVLTTCAPDPRSWKNEYSEGADRVRGVLVRRFAVSQPGDPAALAHATRHLATSPHGSADELAWVREHGPNAPGLIDHLKRQHKSYDALVFFSLFHATTVQGAGVAPDKTLIFPYLHLTPYLRFGIWADLLRGARGIGYLSGVERHLARAFFSVTPSNHEVVGVGVDPPPRQAYPRHQQDPADAVADEDLLAVEDEGPDEPEYLAGQGIPFRRRHRLYGRFAVYGGRVEQDNGCEEMLEYFDTYAEGRDDASLVLMGVKMMKLPAIKGARLAGVLPDRDRLVAYEAADVTIAPEARDLLAQTTLESMAVGTPVLVNAGNESAVEHCRRAGAGLYYGSRGEFVEALGLLMSDPSLRDTLGRNGRRYVRHNYRWEAVVGRFERLASRLRAR
ncbi:MAG: glycosyltransferase [Vicinamibacterales bacterium]